MVAGLCALVMRPRRLIRSAIVLKPSTLLESSSRADQAEISPAVLVLAHSPRSHKGQCCWSLNLFRCESVVLRAHWVSRHGPWHRRIVGFGCTAAPWMAPGCVACSMSDTWPSSPKYLSSDHDPLYRCHQWQANCASSTWQKSRRCHTCRLASVREQLIGTIRRECLVRTSSGRRPIWR